MDIIETEFQSNAIHVGTMYLYDCMNAVRLISRCKELGIKISTIESFLVGENTIQPSMEHIIDFPISHYNEGIDYWDEAIKFINDRCGTGFVFDIIY